MAATHAAAFIDMRPWSEAEFAALLAQRSVFACGDRRAFALARVAADEAELLSIATHPDHRRTGLALAVMAEWQVEAARRGASRGFLEVAADNPAALALYQKCGFETCAIRSRYYRRDGATAVDALVLERALRV